MGAPDHLVLDQLRAIRGDLGGMFDAIHAIGCEMTAIRQQIASILTVAAPDHPAMTVIKTPAD